MLATLTVKIAAMHKRFEEVSTKVALGADAALILDGAGWHRPSGALRVPANITLIPLPLCYPELNPIEKIWSYLRGNKLSMTV